MDFELAAIDKEIFVDAKEIFGRIGAKIRIEQKDTVNPVLIVEKRAVMQNYPLAETLSGWECIEKNTGCRG